MFPIPKSFFLTRGIGTHKERLTAFELALRDADIEQQNLVTVSSILPPACIERGHGLHGNEQARPAHPLKPAERDRL